MPERSQRDVVRHGAWLPQDPAAVEDWAHRFSSRVAANPPARLAPVIEEFADLIAEDPVIRMYITEMIDQVPKTKRYKTHHIRSVTHLLTLLNAVLTHAPEFDTTALVGCPLNAILDWSMGTRAGFAAFRHPPINAMLKKILTTWCAFLDSDASLYVLNDSPAGWKCGKACELTGIAEFEHDPHHPTWGFRSWNDFFTRRFRPGMRPVAHPDNDAVVVNCCESTPYKLAAGVKCQDRFWVKGQPYSVKDMLANDAAAEEFAGGTIYQAFLSAYNYHRWHSPVSGTILKAERVEGTYFSEAECEGEDPAGPNNSQGYITHVATRAIIHIQADHPAIGRLVVIPVGMGEVSSCIIDSKIKPGARVAKGDELGFFQFGGSTVCLVFRPGAIAAFAAKSVPQAYGGLPPAMRVNALLASAEA